jgi:hypothetical protein
MERFRMRVRLGRRDNSVTFVRAAISVKYIPMPLFSRHFRLNKTQGELDFIDVNLSTDTPLFIDPFAISLRQDRWGYDAHAIIISFFQAVIDAIRNNQMHRARELLSHLSEPNETRLGFSNNRPQGAGIGKLQAESLLTALRDSEAVQTGFLASLEECELMISGIGPDKISDLTTNVLRAHLASYTKDQCDLHAVPTRPCAVGPHFNPQTHTWVNNYLQVPVVDGMPVLLVPKSIARISPSYDHRIFYRRFALEFLRAEHLHAGSALVHTFKNGNQTVFIRTLQEYYPLTKEYLFRFAREHPEILDEYREELKELELKGLNVAVDPHEEIALARALQTALQAIPPGGDAASEYHRFMIGALEFIFYPSLVCPRKEVEIHDGRKRIDIVMENAAPDGIFHRLHSVRQLPCAFIAIECKNYSREIANPELDQIAGRFNPNRGKAGIVCCRTFEDRTRFIARCRDTLGDDRGLVIPLDDRTVIELLQLIEQQRRNTIDQRLTAIVNEVWLA